MSVIVIMKIPADTDTFRASLDERADDYRSLKEQAQAAGGIHHQYIVGDGFGVLLDEWETLEAFQAFFAQQAIQEFTAAVGGDTSVPAEITVGVAVDSPDKY